MTSYYPFADASDVADLWSSYTAADEQRVASLIEKAAAKLVHVCPFNLDERIALFATTPAAPTALDPSVVADVVAQIVKRFLVNQDGFASSSEAAGPFSRSGTYVNRYDKTGSDVRGAIQVTESDIDQLRPAVPAAVASSFRYRVPRPKILVPAYRSIGQSGLGKPFIVEDIAPGTGVE